MKFTKKEIILLLTGVNALAENARRAKELVYNDRAEEAIEAYIQSLEELNLKLSELDPEE